MDIRKEKQHNQSIGKQKLLSSNAGVGSIITTKWGGFIMPLSIDHWKFIDVIKRAIKEKKADNEKIDIFKLQEDYGVELIEDNRFVQFLKFKYGYKNLHCFATIPLMQLDKWNQVDLKNNPTYKNHLARKGARLAEDMFYIPAINFPRWFVSSNSELKPLEEWMEIWKTNRCNDGNMQYFAPPRDPYKKTARTYKDENLTDNQEYGLLKSVPLVLICRNGHISDIPWEKFFCASLNHEAMNSDEGFDLFNYNCDDCVCGGRHKIKWISSRNQAESWGILKCSKCEKSVSLTSIMNIKPLCRGDLPWLGPGERELCPGVKTKMQVAIVTSNSIYYANGFSSLHIPQELYPQRSGKISPLAKDALEKLNERYNKLNSKNPLTPEDYWIKKHYDKGSDNFFDDASTDWDIEGLTEIDYENIRDIFLGKCETEEENDPIATYRNDEFIVLTDPLNPNCKSTSLEFNEVEIPHNLKPYIKTIKQVSTLSLISTQLGFGRVQMPTSQIGDDGQIVGPGEEMKTIYNGLPEDVFVLPANQTYGEGVFISFDNETIDKWVDEYQLESRYDVHIEHGSMGEFLAKEISIYGRARFYLLHTFSHILMKELEFSCGYPSASLAERLYYSDTMCGVLIYTADGSEGSMGGLVWQGQTRLIGKLIESALKRAQNCSSDPLCWENVDGLSKASCFSCTMVSETSCEHMNMALDRRALIDEEFGFFKDIL